MLNTKKRPGHAPGVHYKVNGMTEVVSYPSLEVMFTVIPLADRYMIIFPRAPGPQDDPNFPGLVPQTLLWLYVHSYYSVHAV